MHARFLLNERVQPAGACMSIVLGNVTDVFGRPLSRNFDEYHQKAEKALRVAIYRALFSFFFFWRAPSAAGFRGDFRGGLRGGDALPRWLPRRKHVLVDEWRR